MDERTEETTTPADEHAEEADAAKAHVAGSGPTADEEKAADRVAGLADEEVARHEREMQALGADARGEGELG
jgi:hypothetical protein